MNAVDQAVEDAILRAERNGSLARFMAKAFPNGVPVADSASLPPALDSETTVNSDEGNLSKKDISPKDLGEKGFAR